jgi:hypothetical protein
MTNGKTNLPQVVTAAPGFGGVSPPFSILPEKLAERTEAVGHAVLHMMAAAPARRKEAAETLSSRMEEVVVSFDEFRIETSNSLQSVAAVTGEAFRKNVEQGLRYVDDLVSAKGLTDILHIQTAFFSSQIELFAEQARQMQRAATMFLWRQR